MTLAGIKWIASFSLMDSTTVLHDSDFLELPIFSRKFLEFRRRYLSLLESCYFTLWYDLEETEIKNELGLGILL